MAVGTYDANGIWHYGESDNIAPFSTTLNKLADSASSAITSDRARLATLEAGSLAGLVPVKPTTVTAVTGTAALSTNGSVLFTGCTKIVLDGVFSPRYRNYKILLSNGSVSAYIPQIGLRYYKNGVEQTGTNHTMAGRYQRSDAANGNISSANQTFFAITEHNTVAGAFNFSFDVLDPYSGLRPTMVGSTTAWPYPYETRTEALWFDIGTAQNFTGISLFSSNTSTITGRFQVLGYND